MNFQSTIYVENSNNINFIHNATIRLGAKILDKIFDPPKILKKKKKKWYPSTIWEIFGLTVTANMNQISTPGMSWRNLRLMLAI